VFPVHFIAPQHPSWCRLIFEVETRHLGVIFSPYWYGTIPEMGDISNLAWSQVHLEFRLSPGIVLSSSFFEVADLIAGHKELAQG